MRVFISYSRKNLDFVDQLATALQGHEIEVLLDRGEIRALDDFKKKLEEMLRRAEVVLFVVSPNWTVSEYCLWELEQARGWGKKLAPLLLEKPEEGSVPDTLSRLQYFEYDETADWDDEVQRLIDALDADLDWVRMHSKVQELALRWQEVGRRDDHCLRGRELREARRWQRKPVPKGGEITALQHKYVARSRRVASPIYQGVRHSQQSANAVIETATESFVNSGTKGLAWIIQGLLVLLAWALRLVLKLTLNATVWVVLNFTRWVALAAVLGTLFYTYRKEVDIARNATFAAYSSTVSWFGNCAFFADRMAGYKITFAYERAIPTKGDPSPNAQFVRVNFEDRLSCDALVQAEEADIATGASALLTVDRYDAGRDLLHLSTAQGD